MLLVQLEEIYLLIVNLFILLLCIEKVLSKAPSAITDFEYYSILSIRNPTMFGFNSLISLNVSAGFFENKVQGWKIYKNLNLSNWCVRLKFDIFTAY